MSSLLSPGCLEKPGDAYERLKALIRRIGGAVVAFSGGVDSSLLLAAAHDALGPRVLGVTARSPAYPPHELEQAVAVARWIGVRHQLVDSCEMDDANYRANPPDRCYYCKRELFRVLQAIAAREGLAAVLDGNHHDDRHDVRPGRKAARELGVRSPLAELGFGKELIRRMARDRGLPNWDRAASACLASRIPYGQPITADRLRRVDAAEQGLRELGYRVVRVRDHGDLARIELAADDLDRATRSENRRRLVEICRQQGYVFVCLDLEGYRTGSMNETLGRNARADGVAT